MEQEKLRHAAQCAIKFIEEYSGEGEKTKRYKALKALAELTLTDLENGKPADQCHYSFHYLFPRINNNNIGDDESKRKKIYSYLKSLGEKLPSHESMLKQIACENELLTIPSLGIKEGGGSGNYSTHFITPIDLTSDETPLSTKPLPDGGIRYYLETIESLPFWAGWLDNFELSEWRLKFIAILMLLILAAGIFLYLIFFGVFINSGSTGLDILRSFVGTTGLCIVIFWPFRLIYLCVIKRIIPAPTLFLPYNVLNAQIECVATDKIRKSTGRPVRQFRLVSYASKCPLCGSRIEVESGGKEFHHRLIGRCQESPVEHVYSFDRVLRIGSPLRKDM